MSSVWKNHLVIATLFIVSVLLLFMVQMQSSTYSRQLKLQSGIFGNFLPSVNYETLGGLLPDAPNDACLSRGGHVFTRSQENYLPSAYLIHKLRKYEKLHRNCAGEAEYFTLGTDPASNLTIQAGNLSSACNFVVWISYEGLGNKLLSLVSSFVYALVTNRVLLVDRGTDMPELLCEPFTGSSWFLPENFPSDWLHSLDAPSLNRFGTLIGKDGCRVTPENTTFPNVVYIHMNWDSRDESDKRFFCEQEQKLLSQVPWIMMRSNTHYIPGLYFMPSFRKELEKLFPDPETVFRYTARYLLHPSNVVWARISRYYKTYLAKSDLLVGLQLRPFDSRAEVLDRYYSEQVLPCLLREHILPNVSDHEDEVSREDGDKTSSVLVASLHEVYYERLKERFLRYPTTDGSLVNVHMASHEEVQQTNAAEHDKKALMEIFLLSMSDILITSPRSTFGYVAHGLSGIKPWILRGFQDSQVSEPICAMSPSADPCYLVPPPSYDCDCAGGKPPGNVASVVKPCSDDPTRGVHGITWTWLGAKAAVLRCCQAVLLTS